MLAQDRVHHYFKLQADAAFDLAVTRQAQAVFDLFIKYLKDAKLKQEFFEGEVSLDNIFGFRYQNTYFHPFTRSGINLRIVDMHIVSCYAGRFTKIPEAANLEIMLCFHDDLDFSNAGVYYGFGSNNEKKVIVLYYYLPPEDSMHPQEFPYAAFKKHFFTDRRGMSEIRTTFVHEYFHFNDDLRARVKSTQGNKSKVIDPKDNFPEYINSHTEVNARYAQWITNIVDSFPRLTTIRQKGIVARFPTFNSFWDFYWTQEGFVPTELKKYARKGIKQKLVKRLHKFWEFCVSQKDKTITDKKAIDFVKDQILREYTIQDKNILDYDRFDITPRGY